MRTVIATDLDGTVVFSRRSLEGRHVPPGLVPVDRYNGQDLAYMSAYAAQAWARLATAGLLVPATTRTSPQFARLRLPGPPTTYAIVCNGARILVAGEMEPAWERAVRRRLRTVAPFALVSQQAQQWYERHPFASLRAIDDLFLYFTVRRHEPWLTAFAEQLTGWVVAVGWRASLQGRKLYLLPHTIDKAAAVRYVADRMSADRVVAGGDSLLDAGMLAAADAAIAPAHGELHASQTSSLRRLTTRSTGLDAGDEILRWYEAQAGCTSPVSPRTDRVSG